MANTQHRRLSDQCPLRVSACGRHQKSPARWSHTQTDTVIYSDACSIFCGRIFSTRRGCAVALHLATNRAHINTYEIKVRERICNGHATSHSSARAQPLGRCKNARAMTHAAPNRLRQLLCCVDLLMAEKKTKHSYSYVCPWRKIIIYTLVLARGISRRLTWPSGVRRLCCGWTQSFVQTGCVHIRDLARLLAVFLLDEYITL